MLKDINDKIKDLPSTPSSVNSEMEKLFDNYSRSNTQKLDYEQLDAAAALEYALEGKADDLQKAYDADEQKFEDAITTFDLRKRELSDFEL